MSAIKWVVSVSQATGVTPNNSGKRHGTMNALVKYFRSLAGGHTSGTGHTVAIRDTAAAASATITLASCAAATVILVNGVPFTALSGTPTSGNNEFDMSGTDTADATSLAAAINASTTAGVYNVVTATSALGVVTVTAMIPGVAGNANTVETLGVVPTGTVTYVTPSGTQTVLVNGVTVYNATAGATATLTAAAAAAAINASTDALIAGHVRALSRAGVLHIFAVYGGIRGNGITTTVTGTGATANQTRLAGGTEASFGGVQATGTITCTSVANAETVIINGVTYTAHTNTQANDQFDISGSDTADAANLALAINNSTTAGSATIIATSASNVVTVKARRGGIAGNVITLSSAAGTMVCSVARLATGAAPTTVVLAGGSAVNQTGARATSGAETAMSFSF